MKPDILEFKGSVKSAPLRLKKKTRPGAPGDGGSFQNEAAQRRLVLPSSENRAVTLASRPHASVGRVRLSVAWDESVADEVAIQIGRRKAAVG